MKPYYLLTKPGIIVGNLVTTIAGFILGSRSGFDWKLFTFTFLGLACIIASACVFNNYIDRKADAKMERTKDRPLARGILPVQNALVFGVGLLIIGICLFAFFSRPIALITALTGFFIYVALYSIYKYHSHHSTLVGSLAGATPPVIGYIAASNNLDLGALLLFLILVLWQMPHFYSISLFRMKEYAKAEIPVLPLTQGIRTTKVHMCCYIFAFILSGSMLTVFGYMGNLYLVVLGCLGGIWGYLCFKGFKTDDEILWAKNMFRISLVVVTGLCGMIVISKLLLS